MTWNPGTRPAWVRAVNDGLAGPLTEDALQPFDRDQLLREARVRAGLSGHGPIADFGDDDFLEPLDLLVTGLERDARLTVVGRRLARTHLLRLLAVRLALTAYVRDDPGVRDERVIEPLVVCGAPRTGTSILHALLANDPAHRVPEGWELLMPVPPPDPGHFADDPRIPLADAELRLPDQVTGALDAIHVYGARMPKECLSAQAFSFRSQEFTARYHVPEYTRWLLSCDMTPAYTVHRLVLRVLQRRFTDGRRWVLKSPVHLHSLPELLATYPDARVAVTHRDPLTILGSVTSLIATLRWAHSDHVDVQDIARHHAELYHADLDGLVDSADAGLLGPGRVHHSHYTDFMTAPVDTVRGLYAAFGRELPDDVAAAMSRHLKARPKGAHGEHRYDFSGLGLDRETELARFARYLARFGTGPAPTPPQPEEER